MYLFVSVCKDYKKVLTAIYSREHGQLLLSSLIEVANKFENEVSKQRETTFRIRILKHWPLYDGTLQTFTTLKIKKSYNAWKNLENTQKMSSI